MDHMVNQDPGKTLPLIPIKSRANSPFLVISEWVALPRWWRCIVAPTRDPRVPIRQSRSGPRTAHSRHSIRPQQQHRQVHPQQQVHRRRTEVVVGGSRARSCVRRACTIWWCASTPSDAGETPLPTHFVCGRNRPTSDRSLFSAYVSKLNRPTNQNKSAPTAYFCSILKCGKILSFLTLPLATTFYSNLKYLP